MYDPKHITERIILSNEQIISCVQAMAEDIADCYHPGGAVVVTVLEGARIFSNALRETGKLDPGLFTFCNIKASSYHNCTTTSGQVKLDMTGLSELVRGKNVLIVDDIYDTGNTLSAITEQIEKMSPASIKICVLLRRLTPHKKMMNIDFIGRDIDTEDFLIGFGLDYKGSLRKLPYIATVKEEFR